MARANPEMFTNMVVIYQEVSTEKFKTRYVCSSNIDTVQAMGVIELGKIELVRYTQGF